ncbi:MAG: hypothetical protein LBF89_06010 [Bacteroidales bacterium]|jgi:hypothetical protein|nr:hypothetical protein [Bacteroidales bacterium]
MKTGITEIICTLLLLPAIMLAQSPDAGYKIPNAIRLIRNYLILKNNECPYNHPKSVIFVALKIKFSTGCLWFARVTKMNLDIYTDNHIKNIKSIEQ